MRALRPPAILAPALLVLAAACAADSELGGWDVPEPPQPGVDYRRAGGPLANAGPDRQVLEGQVVVLDAGSSQQGESGRALRYLWTVDPRGALPLAVDDPTARRVRVVAPVLAPGEERAEVWLRLRVDDGVDRAEDEVRLEVIRGPVTAVAPVASAGPDLEVVAGETAVLGPRPGDDAYVDPACAGDCPAPEVTWTLVEGSGATLAPVLDPEPEDGCLLPCARVETFESLGEGTASGDVVAVLSFRVDVVSAVTGLAAAPDFVRLFVKKSGRYPMAAPTVNLEPEPDGPWYVGTEEPLQVNGGAATPLGFRPILGEAEPVPGKWRWDFVRPAPHTPTFLGWAFEGRNGRLRSAPRFLLVDWRGLPAPVADAGPDPAHLVDDVALPPDGCDRVRLVGAQPLAGAGLATSAACSYGRTHPELEFCWRQTHGPGVLAGVPASCGERADAFDSGSLLPGCDSDLACPDLVVPSPAGEGDRILAFELRVRRRGATVWSQPDTVVARVVAGRRDDPPAARIAFFRSLGDEGLVPLSGPAREGETVIVDASGSVDPEGLPLSFSVEPVGDAPLAFAPHPSCPVEGACFSVAAPQVTEPTSFPLSVSVSAGDTATVCGPEPQGGVCVDRLGEPLDLPLLFVDDTVNEPPVIVTAEEVEAAPGATVRLDASETYDPNGDPLAFSWTVLVGNLDLADAGTATPSFVAPEAEGELVLELRVTDDRGGEARAAVRIRVRAGAAPPAPPDDLPPE